MYLDRVALSPAQLRRLKMATDAVKDMISGEIEVGSEAVKEAVPPLNRAKRRALEARLKKETPHV